MIFGDRSRLWHPVRIDSANQKQAFYALAHRGVQRLAHQHWMEFEMVVRNAHQVDKNVGAAYGRPCRLRIIRVPGHNFCQLVAAESSAKSWPVAPHNPIRCSIATQSVRNALADSAGSADQIDLLHGCPHRRTHQFAASCLTGLTAAAVS